MFLLFVFQGGDASAAVSSAPKAPGGAPPPPPPGPPPPPAPVASDAPAGGGEDTRAALFAQINRGTAITSGMLETQSKGGNSSRLIVQSCWSSSP